jgi:hypothetical protein
VRRKSAPGIASATVPAFDPADFARPGRDGWDEWTVRVAAVLYVRRHRLADGAPHDEADRLARSFFLHREEHP